MRQWRRREEVSHEAWTGIQIARGSQAPSHFLSEKKQLTRSEHRQSMRYITLCFITQNCSALKEVDTVPTPKRWQEYRVTVGQQFHAAWHIRGDIFYVLATTYCIPITKEIKGKTRYSIAAASDWLSGGITKKLANTLHLKHLPSCTNTGKEEPKQIRTL